MTVPRYPRGWIAALLTASLLFFPCAPAAAAAPSPVEGTAEAPPAQEPGPEVGPESPREPGDPEEPPPAEPPDTEPPDAEPPDAEPPDAEPPDAEPPDAEPPDAEPPDAGMPGAGDRRLAAGLSQGEEHRYAITLDGGPLTLLATPAIPQLLVELRGEDDTLLGRRLLPATPGAAGEATLGPADLPPGTYQLAVALAGPETAAAYTLTLAGEGLDVVPVLPWFDDPAGTHPWTRVEGTVPWTATRPAGRAGAGDSEPTRIGLTVDGEFVAEATALPAGFTLDTRDLTEGLHLLALVAEDALGNQVRRTQQILVDNWDTYRDVSREHWARGSIELLADLAVVSGYPDGTFAPERSVTRAEFARFVAGAAGLAAEPPAQPTFVDVPENAWFYRSVEAAAAAGVIRGEPLPDGRFRFRPQDTITRAEAAAMLVRAAGLAGEAAEAGPGERLSFRDSPSVPAWARGFVLTAQEHGLLTGFPDGTFRPLAPVTRAQTGAMMSRLLR